jgi:tripartite-type tricarboxylate transporter receptor subunit TctC
MTAAGSTASASSSPASRRGRAPAFLCRCATVLCAALVVTAGPAQAQAYPAKTIRFIAPFPAGGGTDGIARTLAQQLGEAMGQQVVVENRSGAGGTIGLAAAADAPADGYTLVLGQLANVGLAPAFYAKLPYDPQADLAPVTKVLTTPFLLVAHPSVPADNAKELIALARARPDELTFGSSGRGALSHLAGEMIKSMANVRILHVPYKGVPLATADLFSGRIALYVSPIPPMLAPLKAGRIKPIGVTSLKRSPAFPDVPTIAESGIPGFEATNWYGVMVPAKTPPPIVKRLHTELMRILELPEVRSRFAAEGGDVTPSTPAEFAAHIRSEIAKWAKIVEESGAARN